MNVREVAARVRAGLRGTRARARSAPGAAVAVASGPSGGDLAAAKGAYAGRGPGPALSYGTVADLAESRERLPWLVGSSFDMKSLQRCWMLKEILAAVEPPGPVLEIGAGEPFVADALQRLGYAVTVVDPYDGSGNGPVELEAFRRRYPSIRFVRDLYPSDQVTEPQAAVYSISVLEHVPVEAASEVSRAARAQGARNIHAIDHVLRGWGDAEHRRRLLILLGELGFEDADVDRTLATVEHDPEAYFVSAEAHEVWRGATPYADYPMRRICSVHVDVSD